MLAIRLAKNENGMAVMEMIPILIIIMLLLTFSFGFFGVIHTGILNSMAARNYAFETFNHRADIRYFRTTVGGRPLDKKSAYHEQHYRLHTIASENRARGDDRAVVTSREITFAWNFGQPDLIANQNKQTHSNEIYNVQDGFRYTNDGVNPVWIQSSYGICLKKECGEE